MHHIHCLRVMLMIVFFERWRIVSQRRFTTFSNVAKTSFRKPCVRSSRQICSIGFISGVEGGICKIVIFSGTSSLLDLCHVAPSQTTTTISFGNSSCSRFRKSCIHFVLQYGITKRNFHPSSAQPHHKHTDIREYGFAGCVRTVFQCAGQRHSEH